MIRWTSLIGALMLVLMMLTGAAHASEPADSYSVAASLLGHFAGDKDEVPSDEHMGAAHHHNLCGEHQVTAPADGPWARRCYATPLPLAARRSMPAPGREPDTDLRPPIA